MADLLTDALPTEWEGHEINWDFRPMVKTLNEITRAKSDAEKAQVAYRAVDRSFPFPVAIEDHPAAFQSLLRFLRGGTDDEDESSEKSSSDSSEELCLDYHHDAAYLIGAFQQAYGIDLTTDRVHWWRFRALMRALPEETPLMRILDIRNADTSEMDEPHRRWYEEQKARCALPPTLRGAKRMETLQEHENAFFDRF